ncbi:unnamed protein product [Miscanthus lutarioriparius]|uniref:Uncharacterized protein n=1 Tax=Miscanthus lutarioriparius TaxID=422564 RepID=A0A811RVY8_9POAL|nr:unnamed protein product [Miscanthus lutarioriparius]
MDMPFPRSIAGPTALRAQLCISGGRGDANIRTSIHHTLVAQASDTTTIQSQQQEHGSARYCSSHARCASTEAAWRKRARAPPCGGREGLVSLPRHATAYGSGQTAWRVRAWRVTGGARPRQHGSTRPGGMGTRTVNAQPSRPRERADPAVREVAPAREGRDAATNPKLRGFYRFQKEYFDELVHKKIIRVSCEQIEEIEEPKTVKDEGVKDLEKKLEKMMWKMNCFIVCLAIVVFGVLVKSIVMA